MKSRHTVSAHIFRIILTLAFMPPLFAPTSTAEAASMPASQAEPAAPAIPVSGPSITVPGDTVILPTASYGTPSNGTTSGGRETTANQAVRGLLTYIPVFQTATVKMLDTCQEGINCTLQISNMLDQFGFVYEPFRIQYSVNGLVFIDLTLTSAPLYIVDFNFSTYGDKTITVRFDDLYDVTINTYVTYISVYTSADFSLTPNPSFTANSPITAKIENIKDQKDIAYVPGSAEVIFLDQNSVQLGTYPLTCPTPCSTTRSFAIGNYVAVFYIDNIEREQIPFTIAADTTPPDVTINQGSTQSDSTNTSPIFFDVTFNEEVRGFDNTDVSISGMAGTPTITVTSTGTGDTYSVEVAGMADGETVTASILANAAQDLAGNNSTVSTSTDNSVTYDTAAIVIATDGITGKNGNSIIQDLGIYDTQFTSFEINFNSAANNPQAPVILTM